MVRAEQAVPQTPAARVLDQLLQEKGLAPGAYTLFFVVGEGTFFTVPGIPVPLETASGYVLDQSGVVHSFWLEQDAARAKPALTEWETIEPEASWWEEEEYQDARRRLGL
ncbi:MAG TPA: hypothetical protein VIU62_01810 [Chloroflexota bacterium]|jgi:hypothetical protein